MYSMHAQTFVRGGNDGFLVVEEPRYICLTWDTKRKNRLYIVTPVCYPFFESLEAVGIRLGCSLLNIQIGTLHLIFYVGQRCYWRYVAWIAFLSTYHIQIEEERSISVLYICIGTVLRNTGYSILIPKYYSSRQPNMKSYKLSYNTRYELQVPTRLVDIWSPPLTCIMHIYVRRVWLDS